MAILQHNGRWYRVSAEQIVELQVDNNKYYASGITPENQIPRKYKPTHNYVGVWEELGSNEVMVCPGDHGGNANNALEEAIAAVLALPPESEACPACGGKELASNWLAGCQTGPDLNCDRCSGRGVVLTEAGKAMRRRQEEAIKTRIVK